MKTKDGYVPHFVGEEFRLGDFGYFEGSIWNRMGNIGDKCPNELQIEQRTAGLLKELSYAISISSNFNVEASAGAHNAKCSIKFKSTDSYFQKALIDYHSMYSSIYEVDRVLKNMCTEGTWKHNYKLIVNVAYAKSFLTILAKNKGVTVDLDVDLCSDDIFELMKERGQVKIINSNENLVSIENKIEDGKHYACAARFVHLKRALPFIGDRDTRYFGDMTTSNQKCETDIDILNQNFKIAFVDDLTE